MKTSIMAKSIDHSLTREIYDLAKFYDDVIDFTLGDPDIIPNGLILESACDAVNTGKTRYSSNAGLYELRRAISTHIWNVHGVRYSPDDEIIVTVGGMGALYLTLACLVDPGDEVIVIGPYYVNYVQMIKMCGGKPVILYTNEKDGFTFSAEELEHMITRKTVAVILNSPCNPTGTILDFKLLTQIGKLAKQYNFTVISDEVYSSLVYVDEKFESIITRTDMKERSLLIDSISKRFSMTGYRVGFAAGPKEIIGNMVKMQENVTACAPLPSQYAAVTAYLKCDNDSKIRDIFRERRDYVCGRINKMAGVHCNVPAATFYCFVNIQETGLDSLQFAKQLLQMKRVAVAPGVAYGMEYNGYIRLAFTLEIKKLREGLDRLDVFLKTIGENR